MSSPNSHKTVTTDKTVCLLCANAVDNQQFALNPEVFGELNNQKTFSFCSTEREFDLFGFYPGRFEGDARFIELGGWQSHSGFWRWSPHLHFSLTLSRRFTAWVFSDLSRFFKSERPHFQKPLGLPSTFTVGGRS